MVKKRSYPVRNSLCCIVPAIVFLSAGCGSKCIDRNTDITNTEWSALVFCNPVPKAEKRVIQLKIYNATTVNFVVKNVTQKEKH